MNKTNNTIQKDIKIYIQRNEVYLVNLLSEPIIEITYSTFSMLTGDDAIAISSAPHYRIKDLPAQHCIHLETLDGWEDGTIYYQIQSLSTASFSSDEVWTLDKKQLSGIVKLPPLVTSNIEKIKTEDHFIVPTPKEDKTTK